MPRSSPAGSTAVIASSETSRYSGLPSSLGSVIGTVAVENEGSTTSFISTSAIGGAVIVVTLKRIVVLCDFERLRRLACSTAYLDVRATPFVLARRRRATSWILEWMREANDLPPCIDVDGGVFSVSTRLAKLDSKTIGSSCRK